MKRKTDVDPMLDQVEACMHTIHSSCMKLHVYMYMCYMRGGGGGGGGGGSDDAEVLCHYSGGVV